MWPRAATYWERWPCCTGSPCHARCSSRRPRPLRSTWCSNACSRCRYRMAHWRTCSGSDEDAMDNVESLLHGFTIAIKLPQLSLMLVDVLIGILVYVLTVLCDNQVVSRLLQLTVVTRIYS